MRQCRSTSSHARRALAPSELDAATTSCLSIGRSRLLQNPDPREQDVWHFKWKLALRARDRKMIKLWFLAGDCKTYYLAEVSGLSDQPRS
jgi:hypothetical protein